MEDDKALAEKTNPVSELRGRETLIAHLPCESWPFGPSVWETEVLLDENAPRSASEYTGPPKRPQDVPIIMPLPAAIDCIASNGGTDPYDREMYEAAIVRVRDSIIVGDLSVSWRPPYGETTLVPSEKFRGVTIAHTYQSGSEFTEAILHEGPVYDLCSNKFLVGGRIVGLELTVAGRDIARFLPFEQEAASAPQFNAPESTVVHLRADAKGVHLQIFRAMESLWNGNIPAIEWGEFKRSVENHIKQFQSKPLSRSSFKRFKKRYFNNFR